MDIKQYLDVRQVPYELIPHPWAHGAAQVAEQTHIEPKKVGKTVLLHANHGYCDVVAIVPANTKVDFEQASKMLGGSEIRLATEKDVAVRCPDCERGVLPPLGSQYGMRTLVDESLTKDGDIVVEGNTRTEALRIKWEDFRWIENPLVGKLSIKE